MKRWAKDEEELLKACVSQRWFYKDIAWELDRSISSVTNKANLMNLVNNSKTKTTEQYKTELPINTILLGRYINDTTKILHKHLLCGLEWEVSPSSILRGNICPRCSKNKKKNSKEYEQKLPKDIEVLEDYKGALTKILHKHSCGYIWKVVPNSILTGHKCPNCAVYGFKHNIPAATYCIYFKDFDLYKIGVTNNYIERFKHFNYTPEIIFIREFEMGKDAKDLEIRWLNNIKDYKVNTGNLRSGNTETFRI